MIKWTVETRKLSEPKAYERNPCRITEKGLNETRESDRWTAWLDFFLQYAQDTANQAARTAGTIDRLFNADMEKILA